MDEATMHDSDSEYRRCAICRKAIVDSVDTWGLNPAGRKCHLRCLYPQNHAADGSLILLAAETLRQRVDRLPPVIVGGTSPQLAQDLIEGMRADNAPGRWRHPSKEWLKIRSSGYRWIIATSILILAMSILGLLIGFLVLGAMSDISKKLAVIEGHIDVRERQYNAHREERSRSGDFLNIQRSLDLGDELSRLREIREDLLPPTHKFEDGVRMLIIVSTLSPVGYVLIVLPLVLLARTRSHYAQMKRILQEDWSLASESNINGSIRIFTVYCVSREDETQHVVRSGRKSTKSLISDIEAMGLKPLLIEDHRALATSRFVDVTPITEPKSIRAE